MAAVLVLAALAAGAVVLLLGRSSLPQLPAAAAVHICPACPAAAQLAEAADCPQQSCPECPPAAAAAGAAIAAAAVEQQPEQEQPQQQQEQPEQQQQQPEQQHQQQDGVNADAGSSGSGDTEAVPLLCGGPGAIPAVDQALAAATSALDASLEAAFAPFEKGFTLEDLMHTADALGVDGAHDTMVWVEVRRERPSVSSPVGRMKTPCPPSLRPCPLSPLLTASACCHPPLLLTRRRPPTTPAHSSNHPKQVRNQSIVFPRRHGTACRWFCNEWVRPLKEGFERGMREGCLRVPDGLPMLWCECGSWPDSTQLSTHGVDGAVPLGLPAGGGMGHLRRLRSLPLLLAAAPRRNVYDYSGCKPGEKVGEEARL